MRLWGIVTIMSLTLSGCGRSTAAPKIQTLPIKGTVTLDGKPLAGADVVFLTRDPPAAFAGTTQEDGTYQLQGVAGRAASCQGPCKVTISRFAKSDGSLLAPGEAPAIVGATEQLPPKYSRSDATVLAETVATEGGTFDFALQSK